MVIAAQIKEIYKLTAELELARFSLYSIQYFILENGPYAG